MPRGLKNIKNIKCKEAAKLTDKQRIFCEEYVSNGFVGVRAARAAGYKGNDSVLAAVAVENLRKLYVKAYVAKLTTKYFENTQARAQDVIKELSLLAMARAEDFVETQKNGTVRIKDLSEMGEKTACLKRIKVKERQNIDGTISVEKDIFWDNKAKALELLAKNMGLIKDVHELQHSGAINLYQEYDLSCLTDEELSQLNKIYDKLEVHRTKNPAK